METLFWIFLIGVIFFAWRVRVAVKEITRANEIVKQVLVSKYIVMSLDSNDQGVFAYRFKSGEFLAHGIDFEKMRENFKARFPDKTGLIVSADGNHKEI